VGVCRFNDESDFLVIIVFHAFAAIYFQSKRMSTDAVCPRINYIGKCLTGISYNPPTVGYSFIYPEMFKVNTFHIYIQSFKFIIKNWKEPSFLVESSLTSTVKEVEDVD